MHKINYNESYRSFNSFWPGGMHRPYLRNGIYSKMEKLFPLKTITQYFKNNSETD